VIFSTCFASYRRNIVDSYLLAHAKYFTSSNKEYFHSEFSSTINFCVSGAHLNFDQLAAIALVKMPVTVKSLIR
jgi:hypothetical protein